MLTSLEVKRGSTLLLDGLPMLVTDVTVQTPAARGVNTMVKTKLRNLLNGSLPSRTFRGGEKIEEAELETSPVQFLYRLDDELHFMDTESFEQFQLTVDEAGDAADYLVEEMELQASRFEGRVIGLRLPNTVNLRVEHADPVVRGDTATAQPKPVRLQTGLVLQVPPHVKIGDLLKIDTRTGKYVERVG